jgi:hypothetical protein
MGQDVQGSPRVTVEPKVLPCLPSQRITHTDNLMTTVTAKPHQHTKEAAKPSTSDKNQATTSASVDHVNHIRTLFAKAGVLAKLGLEQYSKLPSNQRTGAIIAGLVLLFWPLFGVLMISPWVVFGVVLAYSLLYTFPVFVQDLEEAVIAETSISDKVRCI